MSKRKGEPGNRRKLAAGGALVTTVLLLLLLRGGGEERPTHAKRLSVTAHVVTVTSTPVPEEVTASGTVRPVVEARVAPKIMSNVSAVYVREGNHVRKGQLLVRLESRDLQAQVAQARAAVAAAQAGSERASTAVGLQNAQTSTGLASAEAELRAAREQLSLAKEGARKQEKAQAQLGVVQAEAQLRNAEMELGRMKQLYEHGAVPKQRVDGAQTIHDVAKAQYDSAKQQAELVEEGSRRQDIRAAEERVRQAEERVRMARASGLQNRMSRRDAQVAVSQAAQARAGLQYAQVQLDYAAIRSPISGVVTGRFADPGDTVSPGVPVIAVEDNSLYRLEASVPAAEVDALHLGKTVDVNLGSHGRVQGKVSVMSPSGDPNSRKFVVKVDLPRGLNARSGDFGRISFPKSYSAGVVVPKNTIRDEGGLTGVFVVDTRNCARMQVVKIGRTLPDGLEVISGLQPGDRVVVRSTGVLADGVRVRVEEN